MDLIYSMARSNNLYNVEYYYTASYNIYIYKINSLPLITGELDFYFDTDARLSGWKYSRKLAELTTS